LAPRRTTDVVEALPACHRPSAALSAYSWRSPALARCIADNSSEERQEKAHRTPVVLVVTQTVSSARGLVGRGVIASAPTAVSGEGRTVGGIAVSLR
jgi:hypothetical protein